MFLSNTHTLKEVVPRRLRPSPLNGTKDFVLIVVLSSSSEDSESESCKARCPCLALRKAWMAAFLRSSNFVLASIYRRMTAVLELQSAILTWYKTGPVIFFERLGLGCVRLENICNNTAILGHQLTLESILLVELLFVDWLESASTGGANSTFTSASIMLIASPGSTCKISIQ